ncbi:MAG: YIP1 family protein, partial [Myxococcales bacterium]|nr:YIP1 family protein [Myxococcales bacterium]
MRARCANCQHVFSIEGEGAQICPNCGAALHLDLPTTDASTASSVSDFEGDRGIPGGSAPEGFGGNPDPGPAPDLGKSPTPWERRAELGFFKGLFDTIAMSVKNPVGFFSSMPTHDAKGAITYYWLIAGAATLAAGLSGQLVSVVTGADQTNREQLDELAGMLDQMDEAIRPFFEGAYRFLELSTTPSMVLVGMLIGALLFTPLNLVIYAGVYHVCAMLVGAARNGFNATLRALGYSATPLLLCFLPGCGMFFGSIGWFAFAIIGIARLQQVSYGKAAIVVFLMPALFCCFCMCALSMGLGALGALG